MNKYRAIRTEVDGIVFHSKREAARYSELKMLQKIGMIRNLVLQPRFPLMVEGTKICDYVADFSYFEKDSERLVVEDPKGVKTPVYRIKFKLFHACYPHLRITEL